MDEQKAKVLYRYYDDNGLLLYIGISERFDARVRQHENKPWIHQAKKIVLEQHPDRSALLQAEKLAILRERPLFNVHHNTRIRPAKSLPKVVRLGTIYVSAVDQSDRAREMLENRIWHLTNFVRLMGYYFYQSPFRPQKYRSSQIAAISNAREVSSLTGVSFRDICLAVGLDWEFRRTYAAIRDWRSQQSDEGCTCAS
ncbi:hypothetical protein KY389_11370 [Paracoccus bogoriensis]|uniref:hypothetical protein n=1 Tax=Paracoccus bogoriensis TaxID=242065 RepID=UPI001CA5CDAE|nr:hypothetical protein [Paracoccus bogoriensis]MBW7057284.1 hypothetical protein [Paracoccus bogoriensis]